MEWIKGYRQQLFVVGVTLLMFFVSMGLYVQGTLGGDFNKHMLPAKMFGVPADLRARGISELYMTDTDSGWDGQFYFYIANDPLARKDTAMHIDANAYRYQRIGLPFLAFILSNVLFQSWVSPFIYYLTSLLLVLVAVWVAASFFRERGLSVYWALFWPLGMGVQITVLNGLPDAAADALMIISLVALMRGRLVSYSIFAVFAALSREIYVIIPSMVGAFALLDLVLRHRNGDLIKFAEGKWRGILLKFVLHFLPALVFVGWQIFIRIRFHISPSTQAHGILAAPFVTIIKYCKAGFTRNHPIFHEDFFSIYEAWGLVLFTLLILTGLLFALWRVRCAILGGCRGDDNVRILGIGVSVILISSVYFSFGPTVIMHHSGYFKAANFFLFLIPFLYVAIGKPKSFVFKMLLWVFLFSQTTYFSYAWWEKVSSKENLLLRRDATPSSVQYATVEPPELKKFEADIKLVGIDESLEGGFPLFPVKKHSVMRVLLTNKSDAAFSPFIGRGSVNMSYHWLDRRTGEVVGDGNRTLLAKSLQPGETVEVGVVVAFPAKKGDYILRLSPVQEGYAWFYILNAPSKLDIFYSLK